MRQTQGTVRSEAPNWQPWITFYLRALAEQVRKLSRTREARKAQAAASSHAGALKVEVVTQSEGPQTAEAGPEVAPWDEPASIAQEAPQRALEGDGLSDQGEWCPADDEDSEPPW